MIQIASGQKSKEDHSILSCFERFEREAAGKDPSWVHALRKGGISRFAGLGFPTTRHEEWRFTNVASIEKLSFKPILASSANDLAPRKMESFTFEWMKCRRLVFVDGHYSTGLSSPGSSLDGARIESLAAALSANPDIVEKHLARHASCDNHAFVALNTAFFNDGAFIFVPKCKTIQEPIHLLFIASSREKGSAIHPRNLIILEKESKAVIMEHYVGAVDAPYFTNAVTEIVVGENAVLEHCKIQNENQTAFHIASIQTRQEQNSRLMSHSVSVGARLARNDIRVVLGAEGIECILNGLFIANDDQLVDHHTVVDHTKPRCSSHEFYNGVLDGHSRGVFNGKIFVRRDAQKTDAKQTNKNLLLSENATIDTKPQLEIFADDVKCTHGATIGQLDEEAIFYLRSRGIGADTARQMLVYAFASDIINRISMEAVRSQLDNLLLGRLAQHPQPAKSR